MPVGHSAQSSLVDTAVRAHPCMLMSFEGVLFVNDTPPL